MSAGRPLKLSVPDRRRFATMYANPRVAKTDIMACFDLSDWSVTQYAKRLGLPVRPPLPPIAKSRDLAKWRATYQATLARKDAEQVARITVPEPVGPVPTMWRCICGGLSLDGERHPRCTEAQVA